ncbi:MAG: hypothetical protein HQL69_07695 [Magnetococcales bacterium]|nr:hypothetical protein [Magnetococcales bacterium]
MYDRDVCHECQQTDLAHGIGVANAMAHTIPFMFILKWKFMIELSSQPKQTS